MATASHDPNRRFARQLSLFALALVVSAAVGAAAGHLDSATAPEGRAPRVQPSLRPTVEAAFPRESYRPGSIAKLVLFDRVARATVQLFRAGTERSRPGPRDVMLGTPVSRPVRVRGARPVWLRLGDWPSGLYFARVTSGVGVGFAPFVVRPRRLGEHRIAVVLPTLTWQAYNFRDDDGDGSDDSWYADGSKSVRLGRPFENRGVPPHYKHYDQPFLRWLVEQDRRVDYLSQSDVEASSGRALADAYDLILFPGHHEYVTAREYDAVTGYRNLGGNLAFLSANNFYWKVVRRGATLRRVAHWRELGLPEAALIGVQYIANDMGEHRGPWLVRGAASSWIFEGIVGRSRTHFSNGGIEIDKTAPSSPSGTRVLAEIPNLLGRGMTAQMTYYETRAGAKVFAAGAFTLAGAIRQQPVAQLVGNLLDRLGSEREERRTAVSRLSGAQAVVRVPILMYHRIGVTNASTPLATRGLTVHPRTFAQQMLWLHRSGFRTLTQQELYEALARGKRLPPKAVLITFDDGYDDLLRHALPVLERLQMRATAYVITDRCGDWRSPFLAWFELLELERRGVEIGSHTVSHRDLRTLSDRELTHELVSSRRSLERRLHHSVPWLAYPFGGHDSRVVSAARRAGYLLAVTTVGGVQQIGVRPLELRRLSITNGTGTQGLASMLDGSL